MTAVEDLRVVWKEFVPEHERLYHSSAYFRLAITQLAEHVLPALRDGGADAATIQAATKAMVAGFAKVAEEKDRMLATIASMFGVPPNLLSTPRDAERGWFRPERGGWAEDGRLVWLDGVDGSARR